MYSEMGMTPRLGTTVACCHSEVVNLAQVFLVVRAGDCLADHRTIQMRSDAVSEIINHLAARSFHPSNSEPYPIKKPNIIDVWG